MDRDDRLNDNQPADGPAGPGPFDDAVGAYLLDALDEAELAEFEAFLRDDPDAQAEVAELRPSSISCRWRSMTVIMPQPSAGATCPGFCKPPTRTVARHPSGTSEGGAPPIQQPPRPSGPAAAPADRESTAPGGTILPFVRRIGFERLAAGLLALIAAGAIIWGITLQSRLNDTEDDLNAVRDELALSGRHDGVVRTVAYLLDPTADGPETANAIVELQAEESTTQTSPRSGCHRPKRAGSTSSGSLI